MQAITEPPKPADFIPLREYKASTPVQFALEETPVLYLYTETISEGAIIGPASIWVTSAGIHLWQTVAGYFVPHSAIVLHALEKSKVYVHGSNFELWFLHPDPQKLYASIAESIEAQEYRDSSEEEGYYISDGFVDLQSGQGDDENWALPTSNAAAAVAVRMGSLGKRRRNELTD